MGTKTRPGSNERIAVSNAPVVVAPVVLRGVGALISIIVVLLLITGCGPPM